MDRLKKFCLFVVILYLAFAAGMYLLQRALIFKPFDTPPIASDYGLQSNQVKEISVLTEDSIYIKGWLLRSNIPNAPIIILFHGNVGHLGEAMDRANVMLENGYDVLMTEYRGYGGNPGSPSEIGLTRDADAWMSWASNAASLRDKPVILYGLSLGSGLAVKMAKKYPARALILEVPYNSVADIAKHRYPYLPVDLIIKDPFRSDEIISSVTTPLMIVHGTRDKVVPIQFARKLYNLANNPKEFLEIKEGEHNDLYDYNAFEYINGFILKHL